MTKQIIIVVAILGLFGGAWFHGNQHGKATTEAEYIEAENELRSKLAELRRESLKVQREKQAEIDRLRTEADERLAELERTNDQLREYMEAPVPEPAIDYAFGGVRE